MLNYIAQMLKYTLLENVFLCFQTFVLYLFIRMVSGANVLLVYFSSFPPIFIHVLWFNHAPVPSFM
jgi:hypothetical protein